MVPVLITITPCINVYIYLSAMSIFLLIDTFVTHGGSNRHHSRKHKDTFLKQVSELFGSCIRITRDKRECHFGFDIKGGDI